MAATVGVAHARATVRAEAEAQEISPAVQEVRRLALCPCPFSKVWELDDVVPRHRQELRDEWGLGPQVSLSVSFPQAQKLAFVALYHVQDTLGTDVHRTRLGLQ